MARAPDRPADLEAAPCAANKLSVSKPYLERLVVHNHLRFDPCHCIQTDFAARQRFEHHRLPLPQKIDR